MAVCMQAWAQASASPCRWVRQCRTQQHHQPHLLHGLQALLDPDSPRDSYACKPPFCMRPCAHATAGPSRWVRQDTDAWPFYRTAIEPAVSATACLDDGNWHPHPSCAWAAAPCVVHSVTQQPRNVSHINFRLCPAASGCRCSSRAMSA